MCGSGPDVVVLSGGPGCVHYLADDSLAPIGFRSWFPDPRGVSRSGGGPHDMARAIDDLEAIRRAIDIDEWIVLGHSWGSDLAVRYALDHPDRVRGAVGIAGHGLHRDREWSAAYEAGKTSETPVEIDWVPEVHAALWGSFKDWVHQPRLWRSLADSTVPMSTGGEVLGSSPGLAAVTSARHVSTFPSRTQRDRPTGLWTLRPTPCGGGRVEAPPPAPGRRRVHSDRHRQEGIPSRHRWSRVRSRDARDSQPFRTPAAPHLVGQM